MKRCAWVNKNNELYIKYHDLEWWVPVHNDIVFFEFLILEWAQAGLSWETILKKRENYRKAFDGFNPKIIAKYDNLKIEELLNNQWIVRNKLKINSAIKNARVFLDLQKEFWSFDKYIWSFVKHKVINNRFKNLSEIPSKTKLSDTISKDLKKRWMSFVWSTIIYAFMQAVGIVNDHELWCFRYNQV